MPVHVSCGRAYPAMFVNARTAAICSFLVQKRLNLTRTVRKLPINSDLERVGHYIHDDRVLDIKYDELPEVSHVSCSCTCGIFCCCLSLQISCQGRICMHDYPALITLTCPCKLTCVFALQNYTADTINYSSPLSKADFEAAMKKYDISKQKTLC